MPMLAAYLRIVITVVLGLALLGAAVILGSVLLIVAVAVVGGLIVWVKVKQWLQQRRSEKPGSSDPNVKIIDADFEVIEKEKHK